MAVKTEAERKLPDSAISAGLPQAAVDMALRTPAQMQFVEIDESATVIPDTLANMLNQGWSTQRHVKLTQARFLSGIFRGMEDGELSARGNGEIPQIKWVYVEQKGTGVVVRLLGAYNLISQLRRAQDGDEVLIARGVDYPLPNGFRATDYIVLIKPGQHRMPEASQGAKGATVEAQTTK